MPKVSITEIPIREIFVPQNTRKEGWEKEVADLAKSIAESGLIQPIGVVDKNGPEGEKYELVFGFRRLKAFVHLGKRQIPATVLGQRLSAKDKFVLQLAENNDRVDLTPMEEALAIQRGITELSYTAAELAQRLGKTSGYVSQRLSLLAAPEEIQAAVDTGRITVTHARELAKVTDKKAQMKLLRKAESDHTPIAEFRAMVEELPQEEKKKHDPRGRKKKEVVSAVEAPAQTVPSVPDVPATTRTRADIASMMAAVDLLKKTAETTGDKNRINWAQGFNAALAYLFGNKDIALPVPVAASAVPPSLTTP